MRTLRASLVVAIAIPGVTLAQAASSDSVFTPREYSVADFYKTVGYAGASWSPDGRKLLLRSNVTGIWNAYVLPVAGGEPVAVTRSTTNSIFPISYFPDDERILYSSDQGGNELTHLYVVTPDGSARDVTPGAKLKAQFAGWSGDRKSFFVTTNERDERYFDLYEIAVDGYARTMLYQNNEGYEIGAISRDRNWIALGKPRTTADGDIYLYDRRSGAARNITAHGGNVQNQPADFTPDNTKLLFVSDSGREFASLYSYDLASGEKTLVYQEPWDVQGAAFTRSGKQLLVYVNEDSRSSVRLLDPATMRRRSLPGMPTGLVQGLSVSPDDAMLAFYSTDGSVPPDLYVGNGMSSPRRLTNGLNPAIRRADLVVPRIVRFKSYDGIEVPGLLYRPHQASTQSRAAAVVLVHGGPGGQAQVGYSPLTQALVNHGYVVFDINNRGSSGYGKTFYQMDDRRHGEADLGDVVASKRMLIETGFVDSTKIGIVGGSYGGYMVLAALTLQPDAFKVGVDLFGISNWIRTLTNIPPWWSSFREALYVEMGDPKTDSARLVRISPLFNASKIKTPLMVLQGANDPRVLKVESDEIVAAARRNGVPVEYIVFPDEGHGFVKKDNQIRGYTALIAFLDQYLKGTKTKKVAALP